MTRPLMIFAAGFGTRMRPLTDDRPKPLIKVAGTTLLDHGLELAHHAVAQPIVVNAHYKSEMIVDHLKYRDIQVQVEEPKILETGGGLRLALPVLGNGPVATLNADAAWSDTTALSFLWDQWDSDKMDALLLITPTVKAKGHKGAGDFDLKAGNRLSFRSQDTAHYVYTGLQICKSDRLSQFTQEAFSLKELWKTFAAEKSLYGAVYNGTWCDVGHPEALTEAEKIISGSLDA